MQLKNRILYFLLFSLSINTFANEKDFAWYDNSITRMKPSCIANKIKKTENRHSGYAFIKGKCYLGTNNDNILSNTKMQVSVRPINYEEGYLSTSEWDNSAKEFSSDSNGIFILRVPIDEDGDHYLLLNPRPFAVQWFNDQNIDNMPTPLHLVIGDTIIHDLHLYKGNQMTFEFPENSVDDIVNISMYDMNELLILKKSIFIREEKRSLTLSGIPNGDFIFKFSVSADINTYILKYESYILPEKDMDFNDKIFQFNGSQNDTIKCKLHELNKTFDYSWINISKEDSTDNTSIVLSNLDDQNLKYSSSTNNSITKSILQNKRTMIALSENELLSTDPINTNYPGMIWYPGTHFKEYSEIFTFTSSDTIGYIISNNEPFGRIGGYIPVTDRVTYSILFSNLDNEYLGAEFQIYSNDFFSVNSDTGIYDVSFIPTTKEYGIEECLPAKTFDNIVIENDNETKISNFDSVEAKYCINGELSSTKDAVVACFNETGKLISLNTINISKYFESFYGPKSFFFQYSHLLPGPYTVQFSLNGIKNSGNFYLAKIERNISNMDSVLVSWYGGTNEYKTIRWIDDVASLKIPTTAEKVHIDEGSYLTTINDWDNSAIISNVKKSITGINVFLHNDLLIIRNQKLHNIDKVKLYNIMGQVVASIKLSDKKQQVMIDIDDFSNGVYFCKIIIDSKQLIQRFIIR